MEQKAFQDYYPEEVSHCYGCGRLNPEGIHIRSFWEGEESVARYTPDPKYKAIPGLVYGGLLASLIDCHGTGTAAAALYRAEKRAMDTEPAIRCVTASLKVDYLQPTPLGPVLEIRATVKEVKGRRVTVAERILANGVECVRGEVVAVRLSDDMLRWVQEASRSTSIG